MTTIYKSIIEDILAASRTAFPDLAKFSVVTGPIRLSISPVSARFVRIGVQDVMDLNFKGFELFEQTAEGEISSVSAVDSEITSDEADVMYSDDSTASEEDDPDNAGTGSSQKWLILDLGAPHNLAQVSLSLELYAAASSPLIIETSLEKVYWQTVYNYKTRVRDRTKFIRSIARAAQFNSWESEHLPTVAEIVAAMLANRHIHGPKLLKKSTLPREVVTEIRQTFNEGALKDKQLEWNHHGVRRTFRFWTTEEKVKYITAANTFIEKLSEQVSDKVCLGFGSVLSLVRNRDLIPFDDDLDIIIAFDRKKVPTLTEGFKILADFANRNGFEIKDLTPKSHRQLVIERGAKKVDVFVGLCDDDRVSWFPTRRNCHKISEIFPPITASMLGVECKIPANPLKYLEVVYGQTWHIEDPYFRHPWNTKEYDDIL